MGREESWTHSETPRRASMMPMDEALLLALPRMLPKAITWVEAREREILVQGQPLNFSGVRLARTVGILHPERIRVRLVTQMPIPEDPELQAAAVQTGLLGPDTKGITFGYGICLLQAHPRLISHECRHVFQYEQAGSIGPFLEVYLGQIARYGYYDAPLEIDARRWEQIRS